MSNDLHREPADFLEFCYRRYWLTLGASDEHATTIAHCVSHGDRMGKINQGMGVMETLVITHRSGNLNLDTVPELVDEGPTWALFEGHQSSGFWTVMRATRAAMEKARSSGVAIGMGRNHNDGGCFSSYTTLAAEHGMLAMATNNSLPLVSPWGGMQNVLSGAPLSVASPGGKEPPIIADMAMIEAYDADISEAHFTDSRLKGKYLVDPETGELTDDPGPFFRELEGYGRIADCDAPTVFDTPRLYAMNCVSEMFATFLVPGATISPDMPQPVAAWGEPQGMGSVGGSFVLVIDPSVVGNLADTQDKSDRFSRACKTAKRRPGVEEIFLPGERGWRARQRGDDVALLPSHWQAFNGILREANLDVDALREEWQAE